VTSTRRGEKKNESGVGRRVILFGRRIKKINQLWMIKGKKLTKFGKRSPNSAYLKLANLRMKSIYTKQKVIGQRGENIDMVGNRIKVNRRKLIDLSIKEIKIIRLKQ
jgi:hypothetical protein